MSPDRKKPHITYIVPSLHQYGGIQKLAKNTSSSLRSEYLFELIDYQYELNSPFQNILHRATYPLNAYLFKQFFSLPYRNRFTTGHGLFHFWHIEAAMAFLHVPYVVSCFGLELLPINVRYYRRALYQQVLRKAQKVVTISKFTKKLIQDIAHIPDSKIELIYPFVDFQRLSSVPKINTKKLTVGTLCRLVKRKNITRIIESLNILRVQFGYDFEFYLAGDGPEKENILEHLQKAQFQWKYFGSISEHDKVTSFYPSLDVFVLPTIAVPNSIEGFGIVYLEANAFGIPVVASNIGGVSEAVSDKVSGVFANPLDPQDIAIKILHVINTRQQLSLTSRSWAKKFSETIIAESWHSLYREILKT